MTAEEAMSRLDETFRKNPGKTLKWEWPCQFGTVVVCLDREDWGLWTDEEKRDWLNGMDKLCPDHTTPKVA